MLTDFLLAIVAAGGFLYGFHVMRRLDGFMSSNVNVKMEKEEKKKDYVVIFGEREEPELKKWFTNAGFQVSFTMDVHLEEAWKDIRYFVAVSSSDVDNLSMCNLIRKNCRKAELYSVCNERAVRKFYRQAGAVAFAGREELLQGMELITLEHEVGAA